MRRAFVAVGAAALFGAVACSALLGLEERRLTPNAEGGAPEDAGVGDTGPSPCKGAARHAFCEDFDDIDTPFDAAIGLWSRWGYLQGYVGDSPLAGSSMTIETDPGLRTPPHDLRVDVKVPTLINNNVAVGMMLHQAKTDDPTVLGIDVRMLVRVDRFDPQADAATLLDSGEQLIGGTVALANPDTNNGLAVVWTSTGAILGYATGLATLQSRFAQGSTFWPYGPVRGAWLPLRLVVAPRTHATLASLDCKSGLSLYQADGGVYVGDAGVDGGHEVPYAVGVFFAPAGSACELLGADLNGPAWTRQAVIMIGIAATGAGDMAASFDDVVVDFLR